MKKIELITDLKEGQLQLGLGGVKDMAKSGFFLYRL